MVFKKTKYANNGNLAVIAFEDDGECYGNLTVNVIPMKADYFAALDTNNFPNAEKTAIELGATPTGTSVESGFCVYPIYNFSKTNIPNLD